jgi:Spy/CpxP family protein refolding chaperone
MRSPLYHTALRSSGLRHRDCNLIGCIINDSRNVPRAEHRIQRNRTLRTAWFGRGVLQCAFALWASALTLAHAGNPLGEAHAEPARPQAPRYHNGLNLEHRISQFANALNLDADQQSRLKGLLLMQGEEIKRVWSDGSVPAAYRVAATRAISDKTTNQIRALLNAEQRAKYTPPKQSREAGNPNAEELINATNSAWAKN